MYIHPKYRNRTDCGLFSNQDFPMLHFRQVFPGMLSFFISIDGEKFYTYCSTFPFFQKFGTFPYFQFVFEFFRYLVQYLPKIHTFWCSLKHTLALTCTNFLHTSLLVDYISPPWKASAPTLAERSIFTNLYSKCLNFEKFWKMCHKVDL